MKTLKLVLKKRWYDLIASGKKTEEYREIKPYWGIRLNNLPQGHLLFSYREGYSPVPFKKYDSVTFYLGYAKTRPSMSYEVNDITIGEGKPEWGAEPGKKYFIIKLGAKL